RSLILDLSPLVFIYEGQTTDQRKQIPTTRGCYILFPLEFDCFIKSITSLWRASCSVAPVAGSDMKKLGWILFSLCDFTKADYSRVNGTAPSIRLRASLPAVCMTKSATSSIASPQDLAIRNF